MSEVFGQMCVRVTFVRARFDTYPHFGCDFVPEIRNQDVQTVARMKSTLAPRLPMELVWFLCINYERSARAQNTVMQSHRNYDGFVYVRIAVVLILFSVVFYFASDSYAIGKTAWNIKTSGYAIAKISCQHSAWESDGLPQPNTWIECSAGSGSTPSALLLINSWCRTHFFLSRKWRKQTSTLTRSLAVRSGAVAPVHCADRDEYIINTLLWLWIFYFYFYYRIALRVTCEIFDGVADTLRASARAQHMIYDLVPNSICIYVLHHLSIHPTHSANTHAVFASPLEF